MKRKKREQAVGSRKCRGGVALPLVEADYIANAIENGYSENNVRNFMEKVFKTDAGKRLISSILLRS